MGFEAATPERSGVTSKHLGAIHKKCMEKNTFLFLRPSTAATMRLIDAGFATKSMDIHDKSSDWGLTSGLVPIDQAFSKKLIGQPNPDIHPHPHGDAQAVHLCYRQDQLQSLLSKRHFEHTTKEADSGEYSVFHSSKNTNIEFLWKKVDGKVFWRWRTKTPNPAIPMWVWGYNKVPVTGDYDMWMVAPHVSEVSGQKEILSVKDSHGRSAASKFTIALIPALNAACGQTTRPVFNHGAEAQNFSFTQELDLYLVLFCPGTLGPVMVPRMVLPGVMHDLLRHGYVAVLNPKWRSGVTLGIEDMAMATEHGFAPTGAVGAGKSAMELLKSNAASRIALAWKQKKGSIDASLSKALTEGAANWNKRFELLRFFRAIANTAEEQHRNLILPDQAFPKDRPGAAEDTRELARTMAREIESMFGRTGFVNEGGSVTPVDQTRSTGAEQGVKKLIDLWNSRAGKPGP